MEACCLPHFTDTYISFLYVVAFASVLTACPLAPVARIIAYCAVPMVESPVDLKYGLFFLLQARGHGVSTACCAFCSLVFDCGAVLVT